MTTENIRRKVRQIQRKYGTSDPYTLCASMGILITSPSMGTYEGACRGFLIKVGRQLCIVLNRDLPEPLRRIIMAHELGHAVLHRDRAGRPASGADDGPPVSLLLESEANRFAAELLLPDGEVLAPLADGVPFWEMATRLRVPPELLAVKFRLLRQAGHQIAEPPLAVPDDFLKWIPIVTDAPQSAAASVP